MDCNSIAWLVDILGTTNLLAYIITPAQMNPQYPVEDISARGPRRSRFRSNRSFDDGLYFMDGHWYSCRNNIRKDSYSSLYQIKGTAHFCQTFATLIFLGKDEGFLFENDYTNNIQKAVQFWIDTFQADRNIARFFINNIRTSVYAENGECFDGTNYPLSRATFQQLMTFLQIVKDNARSFTGCMQTE